MIIGTAGHIDHGKTALVRALTGVDTDRLPEERRRGITIELGFAPLVDPELGAIGIVDVPGHEAFVRTMVAGATGIDIALLVVAADEGVMPQTREHVAILNLLGVRRGVVALTKSDLVDDAQCESVEQEVAALLARTALSGSPMIRVSVVTGRGIDALRDALVSTAKAVRDRDGNDLVRLPIDRVFTKAGAGTVVTGTLWSGTLAVGSSVLLLPSGNEGRVRALQTHGHDVEGADPASRVAVALAGVNREAVERGETLVTSAAWKPTRSFRADVTLLDDAPTLGPRARVRLHLGTREVGARVVCVGGALAAGELRTARVALDEPVIVRGGDAFVLRRPSPEATIGGGVVTDAAPPRRRARPFARTGIGTLERLDVIVDEAGLPGVAIDSLPIRLGMTPAEVVEAVRANASLVRISDHVVSTVATQAALNSTLRWLDAFHRTNSAQPGAPLEQVRAEVHAVRDVRQWVLETLVSRGDIAVDGTIVRRATWRPDVDQKESARRTALLARLDTAGVAVPAVKELEREFGSSVFATLRNLERDGVVVALNAERFTTATAVRTLRANVLRSVVPNRGYAPSELKTVFGVTRQYLMPWLEFFDRAGYSRRVGDARQFVPDDR